MNTSVPSLLDNQTRPLAVTVYRRLDPPTAKIASSVIEELNELEATGVIDEVVDVPVPPRIADTDADPAADHESIQLTSVASEAGFSLTPACRTTERMNRLTGDREIITVYPIVTLVVKDASDGSVLAIAPSETDTGHVPVKQLLDELKRTSQ